LPAPIDEHLSAALNVTTDGTALMARPNGLPFSGAAPIERESVRDDSSLQNGYDLDRRQRRPLQPLNRHAVCQYGRNGPDSRILGYNASTPELRPE
jgi:hypothetical protein